MSTMLLERSPAPGDPFKVEALRGGEDTLFSRQAAPFSQQTDPHGRLTLDELITSVWEGLAVRDSVHCPVCAGGMSSGSRASREHGLIGTCGSCGSRLS